MPTNQHIARLQVYLFYRVVPMCEYQAATALQRQNHIRRHNRKGYQHLIDIGIAVTSNGNDFFFI